MWETLLWTLAALLCIAGTAGCMWGYSFFYSIDADQSPLGGICIVGSIMFAWAAIQCLSIVIVGEPLVKSFQVMT